MIIANPLYDTAFKGLIQDPDVAKALIGTLLGTEVLRVDLKPTEHLRPMKKDDIRPSYLRLDYAAVVRNADGTEQKILIEVQKASGAEDICRFREYLAAAGYHSKEEEEDSPLPIVTIYFLGFKLNSVPTPCLKVSRQYIDMLENRVLETKDKFVELLTHDSFIIQAPRIETGENPRTELEKILSVFEQKGFIDVGETIINYKYPVDDNYLKKMVDILHYICTDPEEKKKLDNEAYWNRHEKNTVGRMLKAELKAEKAEQKAAEAVQKAAEVEQKAAEMVQKAEQKAAEAVQKAEQKAAEAVQKAAEAEQKAVTDKAEGLAEGIKEMLKLLELGVSAAEAKEILARKYNGQKI